MTHVPYQDAAEQHPFRSEIKQLHAEVHADEARELAASERISAALAVYDDIIISYGPDDPEPDVHAFDAMKAAIAKADAIRLVAQYARCNGDPAQSRETAPAGEGFVLLPKRATKAMLDAAYAAHDAYEAADTGGWGGLGSVYEAMIAAAPASQAAPVARVDLRAAAVKVLGACNRPHDLDIAMDELEAAVRATPLSPAPPGDAERFEDEEPPQTHIPLDEMSPEGKAALAAVVRAARGMQAASAEPSDLSNLAARFEAMREECKEKARAGFGVERSGHLVPASLLAALGRGEGTAGATEAVRFAIGIDDHYDRLEFLQAWLAGDTSEWPEFATLTASQEQDGEVRS